MLDFINTTAFFIALFIGLLYTYLVTPDPEIIIKYPNPHNVGKIKYTDEAGTCYRYTIERTSCPNKGINSIKPEGVPIGIPNGIGTIGSGMFNGVSTITGPQLSN